MACDIQVYRAAVGLFVSVLVKILTRYACKSAKRIRGLKLHTTAGLLSVASLLAFLLMAGVEPNPGPGQSSVATERKESSRAVNTKATVTQAMSDTEQSSVSAGVCETRDDRLSVAVEMMAAAIKELQTSQKSLSSLIDTRLLELENKLTSRVSQIADHCDILQADVDAMCEQCDSVKEDNADLRSRLEMVEDKCDTADNQSRRNNLLFFGMGPGTGAEHYGCETKVRDFIKHELQISDMILIDQARRVGHAILVRFQSYKQRAEVLWRAKSRKKKSSVYVREDFSQNVQNKRKHLQSLLGTLREDGKQAYMKFDKVVCEGTAYVYNTHSQTIQQLPQTKNSSFQGNRPDQTTGSSRDNSDGYNDRDSPRDRRDAVHAARDLASHNRRHGTASGASHSSSAAPRSGAWSSSNFSSSSRADTDASVGHGACSSSSSSISSGGGSSERASHHANPDGLAGESAALPGSRDRETRSHAASRGTGRGRGRPTVSWR